MGLFNDSKTLRGDPRVRLHANARLTPAARRLLVDRVRKESWAVKAAAEAAGVSRRTGHKWLQRFEEAGESRLCDRSSRPRRIARRLAARVVRADRAAAPAAPDGLGDRRRARPGPLHGLAGACAPGPGPALARDRGRGSAPALRARNARGDAARRREEVRSDPGHRTSHPRRSQPQGARRGLGGGLRLRRRPHPPGLRRGLPERERVLRDGLPPPRPALLRRPRTCAASAC